MNISIPAFIEDDHPLRQALTTSEARWIYGEIWLHHMTGSRKPKESGESGEPETELVRRHVRLMLQRREAAWEKLKKGGRPTPAIRDEMNRNLDEQEALEKLLRFLSPPAELVPDDPPDDEK